MRPIKVSQTGVGISAPQPVNYRQSDFQIGFGVTVDGTVTYTVEHTFELPEDFTDATDYNNNANWFPHETVAAVGTAQDGNYAYPIRALRIQVNAGTGTANGIFLQGH